jgi:choline dehydrogenase-like flavoprotein
VREGNVIVIGTGPAGAAAALALHRAGISVTVLEAGAEHSARGLTIRAPGLTLFRSRRVLPKPAPADGQVEWHHELSAGGLSNHWTCAVPRFAPEDFSEGGEVHEKYCWPISYADLAPYYASIERILRVAGAGEDVAQLPGGEVSHRTLPAPDWRPVVEQACARGQGVTTLPLAYGGAWTLTRSGTPFNSFTRMLEGISASPRFRVVFGARALRLEWSGPQRRVTRVIYRDAASGDERSLGGDAFVVAAGALNSTRLLLESQSSDFPDGLGNTQGLLGRYLHDHPLGKIILQLEKPLSIYPPILMTRVPYEPASRLRGVTTVLWSTTPLRLRRLAALRPDKSAEVGFSLFGMLLPEEHNGVALDKDQAAGLNIRLRFDDGALQTLSRGRERLMEILEAAGYHPSEKRWLVEPPGHSVHYGGTVRMHASPRYGMLDRWNRLHAAPNVLVVDAAAFTTGPEKNPTLTAMAIASRACQHLAEELRF